MVAINRILVLIAHDSMSTAANSRARHLHHGISARQAASSRIKRMHPTTALHPGGAAGSSQHADRFQRPKTPSSTRLQLCSAQQAFLAAPKRSCRYKHVCLPVVIPPDHRRIVSAGPTPRRWSSQNQPRNKEVQA